MPASSGWSLPEHLASVRGRLGLRWSSILAVATLASTFLAAAFLLGGVQAQTETWYARDTANTPLTDCTRNRDLSLSQGAADTTFQMANGDTACFETGSLTVTIETGDWSTFVDFDRSGGVPPDPTVDVAVEIVDATSGTLVETVASCTGLVVDGNNIEHECTVAGVPQKALDEDRVRLTITANVGGPRQPILKYNGGGTTHDTRIVIPQGAAPGSCDALTVVTSDPADQLWFNETVEPDGQAFTTEANVSASFQNGTTPALQVTNDGTADCDITLRLLSDPGTGRSMKFNVTSNAPWPDDAAREVPVDPSNVTACTGVASGGTCDIWLWVDYENALGGSLSVTLRVESA